MRILNNVMGLFSALSAGTNAGKQLMRAGKQLVRTGKMDRSQKSDVCRCIVSFDLEDKFERHSTGKQFRKSVGPRSHEPGTRKEK
jgi:hypothetical protein